MTEPKTMKEKIAKLPAWVRDHIETLERERSAAVAKLTEFLDKQTPSPVFVEEVIGTHVGELRHFQERVYVASDHVSIEAHGVYLRISTKYGNTNDDSIVLQWGQAGRNLSGEVALVPLSFQQARLIAKENMR